MRANFKLDDNNLLVITLDGVVKKSAKIMAAPSTELEWIIADPVNDNSDLIDEVFDVEDACL